MLSSVLGTGDTAGDQKKKSLIGLTVAGRETGQSNTETGAVGTGHGEQETLSGQGVCYFTQGAEEMPHEKGGI